MTDVVTLGPRGEQHVFSRTIDGPPRGADTLERDRQIVERRQRVACRVLDRQAGHARRDAARNAVGHIFGPLSIAGHEVRAHGDVDCGRDALDVAKAPVATEDDLVAAVGEPLRERKARARRRQRRKSQVLKVAGRAHVPRIGNDETAALVQRSKRRASRSHRWSGHTHDDPPFAARAVRVLPLQTTPAAVL
jgi:hypothetical protein